MDGKFQTIQIGQSVFFGAYPQTEAGDDRSPVEWLVLDGDADKALLISRFGLDAKPYHDGKNQESDVPWSECTLRAWLNGDFLRIAFTEEEKRAVILTDVSAVTEKDEAAGEQNGVTQDRIFLLSFSEACKYFEIDSEEMCSFLGCRNDIYAAATDYAVKKGAENCDYSDFTTAEGEPAGCWWLRSFVRRQSGDGMYVDPICGGQSSTGAEDDSIAVRPALWLNLRAAGYRMENCLSQVPEKRENTVHAVQLHGGRKDYAGEGHYFGMTMAAERAAGGFVTDDYVEEYGITESTLCFHSEPYSEFSRIYHSRWDGSDSFSDMADFWNVSGYKVKKPLKRDGIWRVSAGERYTAALTNWRSRLLIWRWNGYGTPRLLLDIELSALAPHLNLPEGIRFVNADAATVPGAIILDYEIPVSPNRKNTFSLKKGALAVPVRRLLLMEEREKAEEDDE